MKFVLKFLTAVFVAWLLLVSCHKEARVGREPAERLSVASELSKRSRPAETDSIEIWKQFRSTHPYHFQSIALSDPAQDGTRTLIVAEPPPHATLEDVLAPLARILRNHSVQRQRIGYDGWARDVVAAVAGSDALIAQSLSDLHRRLFFTTYKAYVLPLPDLPSNIRPMLDIAVNAAELKDWVLDGKQVFTPAGGTTPISREQLFSLPACSVVQSAGGLVGWWIPKQVEVQACRRRFREFALDSDLIIGAVANASGTLIVARKRIVPVNLLPPLRFETVNLLASAQTGGGGELAQSYERNAMFAGRMDEKHDWAPILLSPELRDTEYGGLLNITDQLLKSWSNSGLTRYVYFEYPKPARWPFSRPLFKHLGVRSVVYNWNTSGAAYAVDADDASVLALNRTGALPVSYIPDGMDPESLPPDVARAEDQAYGWFAGIGDPNLARVVQYAALYQIFSAFDVRNVPIQKAEGEYASKRIEEMTEQLSRRISNANDLQLQAMARDAAPILYSIFGGSQKYAEALAYRTLSRFRDSPENPSGTEARTVLSVIAGQRRLSVAYARDVAAQVHGWIHTPAVVLSWNDQYSAIGGHNISARVTNIRVADSIPPGTIRVDDDGGISVNPRDSTRVPGIVRPAGRFERAPPESRRRHIIESFNATLGRPIRTPSTALGIPPRPPGAPPRRPMLAGDAGEPGGPRRIGWEFGARLGERKEDGHPALQGVVRRDGEGFTIEIGGREAVCVTIGDAVDATLALIHETSGDAPEIALDLQGNFTEKEVWAFSKTCTIRSESDGPKRLFTAVDRDARLTNEALRELGRAPFDFAKADVQRKEIRTETGGYTTGLTIVIPRSTGQKATIDVSMRFSLSTTMSTIRNFVARSAEAIRSLLGRIDASIDLIVLNLQVKRTLARLAEQNKVSVELESQRYREGAHEVLIAERLKNDGLPTASGRPA